MREGPSTQIINALLTFLLSAPWTGQDAGNLVSGLRRTWFLLTACCERAIALNPHLSQVHLNFGSLLTSHKRLVETESTYIRPILLEPDSPAGWFNSGGLYPGMKRDAQAEVDLCDRQEMAPEAHYAKARFNLGYALLRHVKWLSCTSLACKKGRGTGSL